MGWYARTSFRQSKGPVVAQGLSTPWQSNQHQLQRSVPRSTELYPCSSLEMDTALIRLPRRSIPLLRPSRFPHGRSKKEFQARPHLCHASNCLPKMSALTTSWNPSWWSSLPGIKQKEQRKKKRLNSRNDDDAPIGLFRAHRFKWRASKYLQEWMNETTERTLNK